MKAPSEVTLEEMRVEIARELAIRKPFYKKQVEYGKMKKETAHLQIIRMEAVLILLDRQIREKGIQQKLF